MTADFGGRVFKTRTMLRRSNPQFACSNTDNCMKVIVTLMAFYVILRWWDATKRPDPNLPPTTVTLSPSDCRKSPTSCSNIRKRAWSNSSTAQRRTGARSQTAAFLFRNWEVSVSNLRIQTDHSEVCHGFSRPLPTNTRIIPQIWSQPPPSTLFPPDSKWT
jgi:hypothetical protein